MQATSPLLVLIVVVWGALVQCSTIASARSVSLRPLEVACMTAGTSKDGMGMSCTEKKCVVAPDGYVIDKLHYKVNEIANNGGFFSASFDDDPPAASLNENEAAQVCISVYANSAGGLKNSGDKGWESVEGSGFLKKLSDHR